MGTPFIGEVRIISFSFPPKGWAFCNGQLLSIGSNQALFAILSTAYGGNGTQNFALPNLQGRVPLHQGSGFNVGATGGEAAHALTIQEMPDHSHTAQASSTAANQINPAGNILAASTGFSLYSNLTSSNLLTLDSSTIASAGNGAAHPNLQPYLALNYIIALSGIFPSRN